jgi:hypothetical protein
MFYTHNFGGVAHMVGTRHTSLLQDQFLCAYRYLLMFLTVVCFVTMGVICLTGQATSSK